MLSLSLYLNKSMKESVFNLALPLEYHGSCVRCNHPTAHTHKAATKSHLPRKPS